jgi:hypothetical protein
MNGLKQTEDAKYASEALVDEPLTFNQEKTDRYRTEVF